MCRVSCECSSAKDWREYKVSLNGQAISDLRQASEIVGKLYPILVDEKGNVIDGYHRLKVDPNWPKIELPGICSEEKRLVARLISNLCRRNMSASEKREILTALGHLYLKQGVPATALIRRISRDTGMSYRWVMLYAPDFLKTRPGLGGPKRYNLEKGLYKSKVASLSTPDFEFIYKPMTESIATVMNFSNTKFANIMIDKVFYTKLNDLANRIGADITTIINNVLLLAYEKIEMLSKNNSPIPV